MNTEIALERLSLDNQATQETIEKTYRKLINRYPPEFHPEKFRQIDEAYRFLTSFPRRLEMMFAPKSETKVVDMTIFKFENRETSTILAQGTKELQRIKLLNYLWES